MNETDQPPVERDTVLAGERGPETRSPVRRKGLETLVVGVLLLVAAFVGTLLLWGSTGSKWMNIVLFGLALGGCVMLIEGLSMAVSGRGLFARIASNLPWFPPGLGSWGLDRNDRSDEVSDGLDTREKR